MIAELFLFLTILLLLLAWFRNSGNLPPGEWGLPVVGYLPFMDRKISKTLIKLRNKYGKIFTIKIGSRVFVVLSDYDLIKSAFQKLELSGRPSFYHFNIVKKYNHIGVILSNGQTWTTNRRFVMRTLRDFGLGKTTILDDTILNEVQSLVQDLKKSLNKPVQVDWNVNVAVLNVIWKLVANRRYEVSDKEVKSFSKNMNDNLEDRDGPIAIMTLFPWLIPLVPDFIKNNWMREANIVRRRDVIFQFLLEVIKDHRKMLDKKNPKDFIDKYLIELEEQENNPDYKHWGDEDLLQNVFDLFLAGSETTASTLRWFFLYMARFSDIQKTVQKEIDENVPKGRNLSLHDKDKLPSLEALIHEVNRNVSLLPNAVYHEVIQDTVLDGYDIPKGTCVVPDIEACHKDPEYWKHPNEFSLENFLDEDRKVLQNKEGYLPFSLGKRACLGESLAKMELFLFTGIILQNFEISEPDGQNVSLEANAHVNGINFAPKFKVILKNRN